MSIDIHIVFGESAAGTLKVALRRPSFGKVIAIPDIFSIGPLSDLQDRLGWINRREWFKSHFSIDMMQYFDEYTDKFNKALVELGSIPDHASILIWNGENAHDQVGLRFMLKILQRRNNDIFVTNATKVYNEYFGGHEYINLGEMELEHVRELLNAHQHFH
jgi:hypothetical protein